MAGSATLTTEPSINAMLEPRIVAASARRLRLHGRSTVACCERMTSSSHGLAWAATARVMFGALWSRFRFAKLAPGLVGGDSIASGARDRRGQAAEALPINRVTLSNVLNGKSGV